MSAAAWLWYAGSITLKGWGKSAMFRCAQTTN